MTLFALIAACYAIGAELAWHNFSSGLAFSFAPAGITVTALLLTDRRGWPIVIAAIVVSEVGVDLQHHLSLLAALGAALANVVEPFYVIEAPDLDAAIAIARTNPVVRDGGGVEIRPVHGGGFVQRDSGPGRADG